MFCPVCFHKLLKMEGDNDCAFTYSVLFLSANVFRETFNEEKRPVDI